MGVSRPRDIRSGGATNADSSSKGAHMSFRPATTLAVTCAVGMSLLLSACGASTPKSTATQENEEKFVKFAKCLREHGVNASTSTGGNGALRVNGTNPQAMEAAQNACKRYRPMGGPANLSPQQKVEREEAVQKFAKCMREHGIKVETSTAGGAVKIGIHGGPGAGGPNPESPAFQAAQKACQGLLPFKGGPGGRVQDSPAGGGPATSKSGPGSSGSGAGLAIGG
jgi:hypothetical protein